MPRGYFKMEKKDMVGRITRALKERLVVVVYTVVVVSTTLSQTTAFAAAVVVVNATL